MGYAIKERMEVIIGMATRKKPSAAANELVRRAYRITGEQDEEIKRLADSSKGQLSDNDIVRLALQHGLQHVKLNVLPVFIAPIDDREENRSE